MENTQVDQNLMKIKLTTLCNLPKPIFVNHEYFTLEINKNKIYAEIKIIKDELKFFHTDYKDYYYLPVEDCAIHKSLATFVDKRPDICLVCILGDGILPCMPGLRRICHRQAVLPEDEGES